MSVKMNLIKVGPAGGKEKKGGVWDEKGKGEIAKIFVSDDKHAIQSLQFLFVKNGNFVLSNRHGDAAHDANFATVVLDYQSEFLTWISGFHDLEPNNKWMYLRSITFSTNKGTYGPYGMKTAVNLKLKEFNFQIGDDRSFGGFHGTKHGNYIESIGLYLNTITSSMINIHKKSSQVKVKDEEQIFDNLTSFWFCF